MTDTLRISAPVKCPAKAITQILDSNTDTLVERAAAIPPRTPLAEGVKIPFGDSVLRIAHKANSRATWEETHDGYILTVSGQKEHLPRRARDAIRKKAITIFGSACDAAFTQASRSYSLRPIRKIVLGDTRGRWGSCAIDGTLRFSWRLVFAPQWILNYVAAHEVAHLAEMSHGPKFWAVVNAINPNAKSARLWLKRYGSQLHRVGPAI